jgi:FAD-dependent oxidoreductase domain-containing protein 1
MHDVVIIGGGLHGCSTAYHLLRREPTLRVAVIEKDSTYEHAASARSNAGVRILFSQEENIAMSRYGHEVYGNYAELMAVDGEPGQLDFNRHGYLFISNTEAEAELMRANYAFQTSLGCEVQLLDGPGVAALYPCFNPDIIVCAAYSPNDGWLDPHGALQGMRRKARSMGADFIDGEVTGIQTDDGPNGRLVRAVTLRDGQRLECGHLVNNTGAWANEICRMAGFEIPVAPLHRATFYLEPGSPIGMTPQTRDGQPVGIRPEGKGFITGNTDFSRAGAFDWTIDHDIFENILWPRLARMVPALETLKVMNSWPCHYAYNTFDGNMLIGTWPDGPSNMVMATGFSGHGLQHAPAAGRALSELILAGRFETIDLDRFHCRRVKEDRAEPEVGVLA